MRRLILAAVLIAAAPVDGSAQGGWDDPFPAHQVMDNLYFVGTGGLGTFLITTPEGHILINTDFERTIPMIERSMAELGFDLADIKIILGSHAHGDHQAADVFLRERIGAQIMIMEEDVEPWQRMNRGAGEVQIDRILHEGHDPFETVRRQPELLGWRRRQPLRGEPAAYQQKQEDGRDEMSEAHGAEGETGAQPR